MQLKFFTIPLLTDTAEEELNKFLRSVKVLDIRRELVIASETAYWAICVLYLPMPVGHAGTEMQSSSSKSVIGKGRIDYREVLPPDEFIVFSELRKIRKQISEADAIPPYVVFTDAELAEIVKSHECTKASLRKIKGVGAAKIEKYGTRFCEMAMPFFASDREISKEDEESGTPF